MKKSDYFYVYAITIFFVPIMLTLLFMSAVSTSYVTWADEVFFLKDNVLVNVIVSVVFTGSVIYLSYLRPLKQLYKKINEDDRLFLILSAICGAQRTPMRFRADAMRNITDAPKLCFNQLFRFYYYSIVLRGPLQYCVG